jgi:hypothetical protein
MLLLFQVFVYLDAREVAVFPVFGFFNSLFTELDALVESGSGFSMGQVS